MSEPWIHELNDMLPSRWFIAFVLVSVPDLYPMRAEAHGR